MTRRNAITAGTILIGSLLISGGFLMAEGASDALEEVSELNEEIQQKRGSVDQLNKQIDLYEEKISQKQAQSASLYGEIDLLENRMAKTKLDIEAAEIEIDIADTEIFLLNTEIKVLEKQLERERDMIKNVLQEIQVEDNNLVLQVFFGTESFSQLFDNLERLETVSSDLKMAVDDARESREELLEKQGSQEDKRDQLQSLEEMLEDRLALLAQESGAKESLISATQQSETEFQQLLDDLHSEQTYINQQITLLQAEIEGRLNENDELGDSSILSWPVDPTIRGISAYFHDPTYPFRNLFEHSGLDLPATTGTQVSAAHPGYVAWTRQGRLYGNYVMLIGTNGISTLYAHMSRIDVTPDQFVARGDSLGGVGSTGLSTGPHVHFEVRKNGIPTNPLDYLISY